MTAYVTPHIFAHGEFPTAANLNTISVGQISINERKPYALFAPCTAKMTTGQATGFYHRHRWLHYKSSGQLIDPVRYADPLELAGEEEVSLPNTSDDWFNVYDLDSVAWLSYGALYFVQGVDFVMELDWETKCE